MESQECSERDVQHNVSGDFRSQTDAIASKWISSPGFRLPLVKYPFSAFFLFLFQTHYNYIREQRERCLGWSQVEGGWPLLLWPFSVFHVNRQRVE